jgi:predicted CopG family antitoxin
MPTIRVTDQTKTALLDLKHGADSMDDVINRLYLKAKLLDNLPSKAKEALQGPEGPH